VITLRRDSWELVLAPEIGGAIAALSVGGRDLLRRAPAGSSDVLEMACFPLAPFANRIAHGRFSFGGREVSLAPNMGDHPHPLHGQGWQAPWSVDEQDANRVVLGFSHPGGDWPWAYDAVQRFELADGRLTVELTVTNRASEPAPVGLGLHPYFPNRAEARLTADLAGVWLTDTLCLPIRRVDGLPLGDWRAGAVLQNAELVDHSHTGWTGAAEIELPGQGLRVRMTTSPNARWLHVYSPPGQTFFAVEPVTHRPDALNAKDPAAEGLQVLEPGASCRLSMTLEAEPVRAAANSSRLTMGEAR